MGPIKTLWASVQGDPVFMRRVNGWLTIFWLAMMPISIATGWVKSVAYVSALSLWALVSGHWSAWQAARVEVNQATEMAARAEQDIAGEVVEQVIARTDVGRTEPSAAALSPGHACDDGLGPRVADRALCGLLERDLADALDRRERRVALLEQRRVARGVELGVARPVLELEPALARAGNRDAHTTKAIERRPAQSPHLIRRARRGVEVEHGGGRQLLHSPRGLSSREQAASQCIGSLTSTLVASAETPNVAAVRAAPTVPECRHAWPRLGPALMPLTTRSGGSPNAPRQPAITARPGGPSIARALIELGAGDRRRARLDLAVGADAPDRGADATHVLLGSHDQDFVPEPVERARKGVEPRRVDAVVVRHQDPHALPTFTSRISTLSASCSIASASPVPRP